MTDKIVEPTTALLTPSDESEFMQVLSTRSPTIQNGFEYWQSKGWPERLPRREDLDPFDVPALMPQIVLLDVRREPRDFFYRVIGTGVTEHLSKDWTGTWMSEIEHQRPPSRIWENCDKVVESKVPALSCVPYVGPHADFLYGEDVILPLGNERGDVEKLLVFVAYIRKQRSW